MNVRTVKSFSTERLEIARHEKFTSSALRRGMMDALAQVKLTHTASADAYMHACWYMCSRLYTRLLTHTGRYQHAR